MRAIFFFCFLMIDQCLAERRFSEWTAARRETIRRLRDIADHVDAVTK